MKNICVIGGSGFVGSRLVEIIKDVTNVKIYDKQISEFYPELVTLGNISEADKLTEALTNIDTVILLAAEHKDNVTPISLYYDVNVEGTKQVLAAMDKCNVKNIIFTSSVAIYGLNKKNPDEDYPADPFNHYGKSKWQAEEILRAWHVKNPDSSLTILRPTVIFGERNRGNVYNLLKQIASGHFLMVGDGKNIKSMAYVGNIVAFIKHLEETQVPGYRVYVYSDKPDMNTIELVNHVEESLGKKLLPIKIPYLIGIIGGYFFDFIAFITRKKLTISSVRVKKFCSTTLFTSHKIQETGFKEQFSLSEGLRKTIEFEFKK